MPMKKKAYIVDIKKIPEKIRQPFIDFDFCNISSSCDVVYKDADWHKLVTDLFYDFVSILLVWEAKCKMSSNWKISVIYLHHSLVINVGKQG